MEQETAHNEHAEVAVRGHTEAATRKKGTAMPNAVVMTGYGSPEVLKWAGVPLREPGEGQIRIKIKAAGISPTDLVLRAGSLKAIPLPPNAVLGFEAAGTVDAVGPGVTGTSIGDGVTALLLGLGGYAEYAVASIWTRKPDTVSWIDAAALPSSAEAAVGVLRQLNVKSGGTLLPLTSASRSPSTPATVLPVPWMRRSPCWPMAGSACARTNPCPCSRPPRPTASWKAAPSTSVSSSPSSSAGEDDAKEAFRFT